MARMFGRAPRGERVTDHVPRNRGTVTTMVGALTLRGGLEAMMTVEGGTDGNVFATFVEKVLAPTLKPGDLVVLDNAGAHRDPRIPPLLARHGAKLVFLPPYSPDLNPIELAWSTLKGFLRGARARTVEVLNNCIAWGMELVTPEMASQFYKHCGYGGQAT